jgi:hypothetical protein
MRMHGWYGDTIIYEREIGMGRLLAGFSQHNTSIKQAIEQYQRFV